VEQAMKQISALSNSEKVFLAGCIKNMILANGTFDDAELNELDLVLEEIEFTDYGDRLTEFEDEIHDNESFWEMAETIEDEETQEMILEILYDLSIQKGLEESTEKSFLDQLKTVWQI
jgi:hypothetical protein